MRMQARFIIPALVLFIVYALLVATFLMANKLDDDTTTAKEESTALSLQHRHLSPALLRDDFFSSPFMIDRDLVSMFEDMDHSLFRRTDPFLDRPRAAPFFPSYPQSFLRGAFFPEQHADRQLYDIREDDNSVTVTVSVPNVPLEDIEIKVINGGVLHIQGASQTDHSSVQFEKRFALGRNMDPDRIEATLNNGVLEIVTPKKKVIEAKQKQVRKIDVKEL